MAFGARHQPRKVNEIVDNGLVLGAYALLSQLPDDALLEAYHGLESLPLINALEMPLAEALGERECLGALRNGLPAVVADNWDVVITCVPTVMGKLGSNPHYGLASEHEGGRAEAVADVVRALELARVTADLSGRRRVRSIEVHSAPRDGMSCASAFRASLTELLEIDAAGASISVEHCDATRPGRAPEKGFLEISEELEVLESIDDERLGLCINWGRSAIEGRSARTPVQHVALAAQSKRLAGIMFSGASDVAGPWGGPWADGHVAPRGAGSAASAWSASLLGEEEIRETLATAAGAPGVFVGVKVTAAPASTSVSERLIVAGKALEMVARIAG